MSIKPTSLFEAIDMFCNYLRSQRGLAVRTVKGYRHDLTNFCRYLIVKKKKDYLKLSELNRDNINAYLINLQDENNYKNTSLSRKISTIKSFLKYLEDQDYITESPRKYLQSPKIPKKLPIYLTQGELRKLLSIPDQSTFAGFRDYTIIMTLGMTGMRLSELVGLNFSDLDFHRNVIRVIGKGSKERAIPMNELLMKILEKYLDMRPYCEDKAIFINQKGTRLSGRFIEKMVKKCAVGASLSWQQITPHKLRHTFATLLHSKNVDLIEIQKLLGHASISSTQIYTHTNLTRLKKAVDELNDLL